MKLTKKNRSLQFVPFSTKMESFHSSFSDNALNGNRAS